MVYAIDIADPAINPVAKFNDLASLLNIIIPFITIAGLLFALVMFFQGGFTILTGQGSPDAIKKGQSYFLWAGAGIIIIVSSMLLIKILAVILNVGPLPF